jgi:hypothetical protein
MNKRKWEFKLHTWLYSKNLNSDSVYGVVCWKSDDGPLIFKNIDETDQRYAIKTHIYMYK